MYIFYALNVNLFQFRVCENKYDDINDLLIELKEQKLKKPLQ